MSKGARNRQQRRQPKIDRSTASQNPSRYIPLSQRIGFRLDDTPENREFAEEITGVPADQLIDEDGLLDSMRAQKNGLAAN